MPFWLRPSPDSDLRWNLSPINWGVMVGLIGLTLLDLSTMHHKVHGAVFPVSDLITIETLLSKPSRYHKKTIRVRGTVTQPELHVDDTGLFLNFVFVLRGSQNSLVVFGRHDRTQGHVPITTDGYVEVTGIFWKDRVAHDYHFQNNLEALKVTTFPSLHPDAA